MAEFPFCLMSARSTDKSGSVIHYERQTTTAEGGVISIRLTVSGSAEHGLPISGDQDIYVALMKFWSQSNFQSNVIEFPSVYALLQSVGIRPDGYSYTRVKEALCRLVGVMCTSEKAFWDVKSRKRKSSKGFHLFESYFIPKDDGDQGVCRVVASDFLFESVKNGNTKLFDIDLYKMLKAPLSKRLYRYLDQMRQSCRRRTWSVSLIKIREALPISSKYDSAQVKRRLSGALEDLVQKRFLKRYQFLQNESKENILRVEFVQQYPRAPEILSEDQARQESIAQEIAGELNDQGNIAYHRKLTRILPEEYLFRALAETKDARHRGLIRETPAKFFTEFVERNYRELRQDDAPRVS